MAIFADGVRITSGTPYLPAISFLDAPSTGIFRVNSSDIGFAVMGNNVMCCTGKSTIFKNNIVIEKGAVDDGYLRANANGVAYWQSSLMQSGTVAWSSLYNLLDTSGSNDTITININKQNEPPNVSIGIESPQPLSDNAFYIKNKNSSSFQIYSTLPIMSNIANKDAACSSIIRLSNNLIGVCYYDVDTDRIYYHHSLDILGKQWSTPVLIDDVSAISSLSMCLVNGAPAVGYIYNEGANDEWRYVRATDPTGTAWSEPVVLATSSVGINFLPVSINLLVLGSHPAYFFNDEDGRAKMFRAMDANGSAWASAVNISNLVNHQLINVKLVGGNPAVVARSNINGNVYYVRASDTNGTSWPIGATQLYKYVNGDNVSIAANIGKSSCDMSTIAGSLSIVISELYTNNIYMSIANDQNGTSWGVFSYIAPAQTSAAYPTIFYNNQHSYLLFNKANESSAAKCLVKFTAPNAYTMKQNFMPTFSGYTEHWCLPNINDGNCSILFLSQNRVSLLRFYDEEFKLNWICHL